MVQPRILHPNIQVNEITNLFQDAASSEFLKHVKSPSINGPQSCQLVGLSRMKPLLYSRPLVP